MIGLADDEISPFNNSRLLAGTLMDAVVEDEVEPDGGSGDGKRRRDRGGDAETGYMALALAEQLSEDGLTVFARGLGVYALAAQLLAVHAQGQGCVVVLGSTPTLRHAIASSMAVSSSALRVENVDASLPSSERLQLYVEPRVVMYVTTRIFVVDLLSRRAPAHLIAGVLVLNAHRAEENSGEGFAVRLYRAANARGFVRGLTESPQALQQRPARVMRALRVRKLNLWPRFQMQVSAGLERRGGPEVVELRQPLSASMAAIQAAIVEVLEGCLAELRTKRRGTSINGGAAAAVVDCTELTLENGLFASFDDALRRQLAPVWHTLTAKTRQLVYDLRTLRQLSAHLIELDAVSFLRHLEALRAGEGAHAAWMYSKAAGVIFERARARCYVVPNAMRPHEAQASGTAARDDTNAKRKKRRNPGPPSAQQQPQMGDAVNEKATSSSNSKKLQKQDEKTSSIQLIPVLEELPKWGLLREILTEVGDKDSVLIAARDAATCAQLRALLTHGASALMSSLFDDFLDGRPALKKLYTRRQKRTRDEDEPKDDGGGDEGSEPSEEEKKSESKDGGIGSHIHLYALNLEDPSFIASVNPSTVIVYDPDPGYIRELEVYQARLTHRRLRVYFLTYAKSLEEHKFLASLKRERRAFEALIREKAHMISHTEQGSEEREQLDLHTISSSSSMSARGGMQTSTLLPRSSSAALARAKPRRVVVDVREFMSMLPAVLHQRGLSIVPVTLEVGDYIVSPDMCVERKSVADLHASFLSGRLFNQAEAMTKHYESPVLLIEFDADKAFYLLARGELPFDITPTCIISKICLLTIHFPRLRIIWSRSLHATADIFSALKKNRDEPDFSVAAAVGTDHLTAGKNDKSTSDASYADTEPLINEAAMETLRRLPGVTATNVWKVLAECSCVADLCELSLEKLIAILGSQKNGRQLHEFLHAKTPQLAPLL